MAEKDITPQTFFDRADACAREGRFDEAIQLYKELHTIKPDDDSVLMALAWTYRDAGRMSEAEECFEILVEKELSRQVFTGFAFDELVRIFRDRGEHEKLLPLCERAVAAQPEDVALLYTLGDACLRAGKAHKAADAFEKLVSIDPDGTAYWCALGDSLVMSGEMDRAEAACEKAASIDPGGAASFYHRFGCILMEAGELERAEAALTKSLGFSEREPLQYCTLGDLLIREGRIEEAVRSYNYAASISAESGGALYNRLGNSMRKFHRVREAVSAFEKALEVEPDNPFYYTNLITSYKEAGMDEKAHRAWEEAHARGVFSK